MVFHALSLHFSKTSPSTLMMFTSVGAATSSRASVVLIAASEIRDLRSSADLSLGVNGQLCSLFVWAHWACNLNKFIPYCFQEVMSFNLHVAGFYMNFS